MKKYERFFIVLGIITTVVLVTSAFLCWVKHSLKIVIDDNFDDDDHEKDEPDVEVAEYNPVEDDYL